MRRCARRQGSATLVVICGRLFARLLGEAGKLPLGADAWAGTRVAAGGLPDGTRLANVLTGETLEVEDGSIALARACASFPVAALLVT